MQDRLIAYIEDPTPQTYDALRQALIHHPAYDPYSADLDRLGELHGAGDYQALMDAIPSTIPNLILSPRFHYFAAVANRELGREEGHQIEMHLCLLCLRGIAETGDGSADRPYRITRVSDEYDMVHFELEDEIDSQALIDGDKGALDLLTLKGGRQVFFDITDCRAAMERKLARDAADHDSPTAPDAH